MNSRGVAVILCICCFHIASTSCGDAGPKLAPAKALAGVTPFSALRDVLLPSTVGEISRQRPGSKLTDFGLSERVDGAELHFYAVASEDSRAWPKPGTPVRGIEAAWYPVGADSAALLWRSSLAGVSRQAGSRPSCFESVRNRLLLARWTLPKGAHVYLQHQLVDSTRRIVSDGMALGLVLDSSELAPRFAGTTAVACR